MKVSVIGLGYIGLPSAVIMANSGHSVLGIDINDSIVEKTKAGHTHISEPNLEQLLKTTLENGNLRAEKIAEPSDIFIIAVPTPFNALGSEKTADLSFLNSAIKSISPLLRPGNLIIIESTVPIGTTDIISEYITTLRNDLTISNSSEYYSTDIHIAFCPERVLPGNILYELENNNRIVGGSSQQAAKIAKAFYSTFVNGEIDIVGEPKIAEAAKLVENTYRDVNIAFSNELSMLAEQLNLNVWDIIKVANKHPRVNILNPGCGVGGHCIAVDPWFLIASNSEYTGLIRLARETNLRKTEYVIQKILECAKKQTDKEIICLGLTYKKNSDDLRESPSLQIFNRLKEKLGLRVNAYDPNLSSANNKLLGSMDNLDGVNPSNTILILLVDHTEFNKPFDNFHLVIDFTGSLGR
jgi:UDP-N-acetyl-D-mannosaminuronic acid dehydrogenase